jgi:hypothetical protein
MLEKFEAFKIENPQVIVGGEVTASANGDSGVE